MAAIPWKGFSGLQVIDKITEKVEGKLNDLNQQAQKDSILMRDSLALLSKDSRTYLKKM
jgi:hypothetical protein